MLTLSAKNRGQCETNLYRQKKVTILHVWCTMHCLHNLFSVYRVANFNLLFIRFVEYIYIYIFIGFI